jgi:hypothetical protein
MVNLIFTVYPLCQLSHLPYLVAFYVLVLFCFLLCPWPYGLGVGVDDSQEKFRHDGKIPAVGIGKRPEKIPVWWEISFWGKQLYHVRPASRPQESLTSNTGFRSPSGNIDKM